MSAEVLDKRLNAYRPDLADAKLKDQVEATTYVEGQAATVATHFADLYDRPQAGAGLQCQVLHGHTVQVFDRSNGWAWVQKQDDGYVGYVEESNLQSIASDPTHMITAPRTFLYSQADLKSPRSGYRSMGSKLSVVDHVTTRGTEYAVLDSGDCVIAKHLLAIGDWFSDPVTVAEKLLHSPYLWGGDTGFGIDCSGLVSLSNMLCGNAVLRDSDMQAASIGTEIETDFTDLQRGDLVFWKGHVGMMADQENLLHANGHSMSVAVENLSNAIERIGYLYGQPTLARRP